jgi:putative MATE family efflux protein
MAESVLADDRRSAGAALPIAAGRGRASERSERVHDPKRTARQAMLQGPILSTMLKLALPSISVFLWQTSVGVVQTFYLSLLGTDALAGVALVFPLLMLMNMMSSGGIGGGVSSAVARALGAGRREDADALVTHALLLALAFGAAFMAAAWLLGPMLYRALGARGAALAATVTYSNFVFLAAVPFWTIDMMAAALRGAGNVRMPALVSFIGAAVTVMLSPALIFGLGPLPALGIAGAGVASSLYNAIAALALLRYMSRGRGGLTLRRVRLERRLFREVLRVGIPSALGTLQANLTTILVTGAIGTFGAAALAAYGTASRLDFLLIRVVFGLGTALAIMVGTNIGAGQVARARRIAWIGAALAVGFTESVGAFVALWPQAWLGLFSNDAAVIAAGSLYFRTVAPVYGAIGLGMAFYFASQGVGRVLWPFLVGTIRMALSAGLGWVLVRYFGFGLPALFTLIAAAAALSGAMNAFVPKLWTHMAPR